MRRIEQAPFLGAVSYPIPKTSITQPIHVYQPTENSKFSGSQVPIAKDYLNWFPYNSDNISIPNGFLEGNLLSKAFACADLVLPNTSVPFFLPLIRSPTTPQYTPATALNFTPGISQMDYFIVIRGITDGSINVIYLNYQNNYNIQPPQISIITNSSTINYNYYYCNDFVADFLKLIETQINASLSSFSILPYCSIIVTSNNYCQFNFSQAFLQNYYVEISQNLKNLINFRTATINLGSETTYRLLFNSQLISINGINCLSSITNLDVSKIIFFKNIFLCSNNFEIANMNLHTNALQFTTTNSLSLPPRTAIFVFRYTGSGVSWNGSFSFSNLTPINTSVRFNYDKFTSDALRLQVFFQLQDNVTFIPYMWGPNDCVDMLFLTYLR